MKEEEGGVHEPFMTLAPKEGWLADYLRFTSWSESPAPFHFFMGAACIGAALGRRVWVNKGYYRIYPNMQILLIAPSGKCRKTTTIAIGTKILQQLGAVNIIQDKTTPEALLEALREPEVVSPQQDKATPRGNLSLEQPDATAIIEAPELAVTLGKQKYNEGMISLLTSLFDSPDEFETRTKSMGKIVLSHVALVFVGASTPDWLITSIPQDAFGGGFMSRILFVVQEDTPRCFPIPAVPEGQKEIVERLARVRTRKGEILPVPDALHWFTMWYTAGKGDIPEDAKMAGYHERKPDHLMRLALILALSDESKQIERHHMVMASKMLSFLEDEMLTTFKWLGMKTAGVEQERIIRTLKSMKGRATHSALLRKLIFYMNAKQFRDAVVTLLESRVVGQSGEVPHCTYFLVEEEGKHEKTEHRICL